MPDPLKQLLLQKMMAEPSQGGSDPQFATPEQSPPNLLDTGVEGVRGLISGLVPGVEAPDTPGGKIGEILGLGAPMMGTAARAMRAGPALTQFLSWLHQAELPTGSLQDALRASKATGFRVPPPTEVKLPKGFVGPSGPIARSPDLVARRVKQEAVDANLKEDKVILSKSNTGKRSGSYHRPDSNVLNEQLVREIRQAVAEGKTTKELRAAYPDIKPATLRGVVTGDTWYWVK